MPHPHRPCPPNTFPYIIKPGDTYWKLAQRFNTTVPAIISANPGVNYHLLRGGQQICIPKK